MAQYYYFKPTGKWKYDGEGKSIPESMWAQRLTHDAICELNNGLMPGIITDGKDLTLVIIDDDSFPRMILAEEGRR